MLGKQNKILKMTSVCDIFVWKHVNSSWLKTKNSCETEVYGYQMILQIAQSFHHFRKWKIRHTDSSKIWWMFLKFQYCINYWGFDADILQLDEMGFELSDKAEDDRYIRMSNFKV